MSRELSQARPGDGVRTRQQLAGFLNAEVFVDLTVQVTFASLARLAVFRAK